MMYLLLVCLPLLWMILAVVRCYASYERVGTKGYGQVTVRVKGQAGGGITLKRVGIHAKYGAESLLS